MRIVLVGTAYPLRGGIAHYIALLYQTLVQRGHDVYVLSFQRQYPKLLFPGKTQEDEGKELIPVRAFPLLDSINPFSWVQALFWLKTIRPDVVCFKYWMPFFAPCYSTLVLGLKYFFHVPSIFICDNIVPHEKKIGDAWLTRVALRFPDFFIVQSETVRSDLLRFRREAIHVKVPHPVYTIFPSPIQKEEARKRLGISPRVPLLLFFGYIRSYKGLSCLIEALPEIRKSLPAELLVAGEFYEEREATLQLIKQLGLEHVVHLHDRFIENEKVAEYFCASDLVVLPYRSATQSGIVQIAYHYEKPVLATSVGGLPEVIRPGKTGYLVPPNDPFSLAKAVVQFFTQDKKIPFGQWIRKEKEAYSWDRMAEAIEKMAGVNHG